ncbi:hypothetical protein [Streptomyces cinereoruber]|uniref:hypothetical protein n=1 Tax=Streptomyces cinereoruber TaxID=67260 RepID=UPI00363725BA
MGANDQGGTVEDKGLGRRWRVGVDISSWPQLKVAHAQSRLLEINSRMNLWHASGALGTETSISEDRRSLEVRLRIKSAPPVQEWALILGDALYGLRSALDACVWEYAHIDGAAPPNPERVQFPVVRKRRNWTDVRSRSLQSVPDEVAERIELLQPFHGGGDPDGHPLSLLSDLNNLDKHRASIEFSLARDSVDQNVAFVFEDDSSVEAPEVTYYLDSVTDGAVIVKVSFAAPVNRIDGGFCVRHLASVSTKVGNLPVLPLVNDLANWVSGILDFIATGPPTREELERHAARNEGEGEWMPMEFKEGAAGSFHFSPEG